jgi:hypothetical protein
MITKFRFESPVGTNHLKWQGMWWKVDAEIRCGKFQLQASLMMMMMMIMVTTMNVQAHKERNFL